MCQRVISVAVNCSTVRTYATVVSQQCTRSLYRSTGLT